MGKASAQAEKSFLFDIVVRTWRVLLHPVAVSVHEELQKYAQISGASASGDYYRGGDTAASAPLDSRISCLRFTRFAGNAADDVALDFVAGVRLDRGRDAIDARRDADHEAANLDRAAACPSSQVREMCEAALVRGQIDLDPWRWHTRAAGSGFHSASPKIAAQPPAKSGPPRASGVPWAKERARLVIQRALRGLSRYVVCGG
jgi:hypothetical protein